MVALVKHQLFATKYSFELKFANVSDHVSSRIAMTEIRGRVSAYRL